MKTFHVDEPREIGKQKVRVSKKELMMAKNDLQERVLRKKIREIVKQNMKDKKKCN